MTTNLLISFYLFSVYFKKELIMAGWYLEDFKLGETYKSIARTVTEADVVNFAGFSGDFNPLHMDDEYGKNVSIFKKRIAHGMIGPVWMTGMSNQTGMFEGTTIAFLELTVKYPAPLEIGATVHLEMTPTEVKHTSKPGKGILKLDANLVDQNGKIITECKWTIMMMARE